MVVGVGAMMKITIDAMPSDTLLRRRDSMEDPSEADHQYIVKLALLGSLRL